MRCVHTITHTTDLSQHDPCLGHIEGSGCGSCYSSSPGPTHSCLPGVNWTPLEAAPRRLERGEGGQDNGEHPEAVLDLYSNYHRFCTLKYSHSGNWMKEKGISLEIVQK